jgi:hypothetical protein
LIRGAREELSQFFVLKMNYGLKKSGETTPLQPSNNGLDDMDANNGGHRLQCSNSNMAMGALVAVVLVLYFGFPTSNTVNILDVAKTGKEEAAAPSGEEVAAEVIYRPFCIDHRAGKETSVKLIQTSMKDPSHQWSLQPCYVVPAKKLPDEEDSYGAPDAHFQVNFSNIVFARRETPILGFGGAFTEASALNFHSLQREGQEAVLELLFGKTGLGYTKGRVHINSCDFSVESYSFDDTVDDFDLKDFDMGVKHDVESGMVDMAMRATTTVRHAWETKDGLDGVLRLYASPWSPPAWMKQPTSEDDYGAEHSANMTGSAQPTCIREGTKEDSPYAKAWALYFSKFLTACKFQYD